MKKERHPIRDYCATCQRVTGTDAVTGECGACIIREGLKPQQHSMKKDNDTNKNDPTITFGGAIALFLLSGVCWFALFANFLTTETFHLHYTCNGMTIEADLVSKDTNLECL